VIRPLLRHICAHSIAVTAEKNVAATRVFKPQTAAFERLPRSCGCLDAQTDRAASVPPTARRVQPHAACRLAHASIQPARLRSDPDPVHRKIQQHAVKNRKLRPNLSRFRISPTSGVMPCSINRPRGGSCFLVDACHLDWLSSDKQVSGAQSRS